MVFIPSSQQSRANIFDSSQDPPQLDEAFAHQISISDAQTVEGSGDSQKEQHSGQRNQRRKNHGEWHRILVNRFKLMTPFNTYSDHSQELIIISRFPVLGLCVIFLSHCV